MAFFREREEAKTQHGLYGGRSGGPCRVPAVSDGRFGRDHRLLYPDNGDSENDSNRIATEIRIKIRTELSKEAKQEVLQ